MALTTYAQNKLADHVLGHASYTMPTTYAALFTVMPTLAGGGTEVTGGGYARQALSTSAASGGVSTSNTALTWSVPACTIVGIGIYDASTSGNLLEFHVIEQTATSESVTLALGIANTAHPNISSVTVKNNTDSTTYVEGTDYYIQYDSGTIALIPGGGITASQVLHVTYNYAVTRTIVDTPTNFTIASGSFSFAFKGWN